MKKNSNENVTQDKKVLNRIGIEPFNKTEKGTITRARRQLCIDRPKFYHDAVIYYSNKVLENANA